MVFFFQKRSEEESPKTVLSSNLAADIFLISDFQLCFPKRLRGSHRLHSQVEGGEREPAGLGLWAEAVCKHGKSQSPSDVGSNPAPPPSRCVILEK